MNFDLTQYISFYGMTYGDGDAHGFMTGNGAGDSTAMNNGDGYGDGETSERGFCWGKGDGSFDGDGHNHHYFENEPYFQKVPRYLCWSFIPIVPSDGKFRNFLFGMPPLP